MYKKEIKKDEIYILIYVDDLLICGKSKENIKCKKLLSDRYKMKDLGKIKEYLGININYNYLENELLLNQTKYI